MVAKCALEFETLEKSKVVLAAHLVRTRGSIHPTSQDFVSNTIGLNVIVKKTENIEQA